MTRFQRMPICATTTSRACRAVTTRKVRHTRRAPWGISRGPGDFGFACYRLVAALVVTGFMRGQLKTVRRKAAASDYVRPGSMNVAYANDVFLYSHVTVRQSRRTRFIPAAPQRTRPPPARPTAVAAENSDFAGKTMIPFRPAAARYGQMQF